MATLAENVSKLVTALAQDKTALTEKGIEVPEGTKHSDIANLIKTIETGGIAYCTVTITLKNTSGEIKTGKTVDVYFNGDPKGTYTLNPNVPYKCEYGPGTYRFEYNMKQDPSDIWHGSKEVVIPFLPEHFDVTIELQDDGKLRFRLKLINGYTGIYYLMDRSSYWGSDYQQSIDFSQSGDDSAEVVMDPKYKGTAAILSDEDSPDTEYSYEGDYPEAIDSTWTGTDLTIPTKYETVTVDWSARHTDHFAP